MTNSVFALLALCVSATTAPMLQSQTVEVKHLRPSRLLQTLNSDPSLLAGMDFTIKADDSKGVFLLDGPATKVGRFRSLVELFDNEPKSIKLLIWFKSKLDHWDTHFDIVGSNSYSSAVSDERSGLVITIRPRINGDGTITLSGTIQYGASSVNLVMRVKNGEGALISSVRHSDNGEVVEPVLKAPAFEGMEVLISPSIVESTGSSKR